MKRKSPPVEEDDELALLAVRELGLSAPARPHVAHKRSKIGGTEGKRTLSGDSTLRPVQRVKEASRSLVKDKGKSLETLTLTPRGNP